MRRYFINFMIKIVAIAILIVLYRVDFHLSIHQVLAHAIYKFIQLLLFVFSLNLCLSVILLFYRKTKKMSLDRQDNITLGLYNLYLLTIGVIVILMVLSMVGIDYRTMFTSLSIVAAATAIVSREFISALIAGFIISVTKELSIGEYVKIGEHKGRIINLNLTKIALLNENEDLIFIANDKAYNSEIINYSQSGQRKVYIDFELGLEYKGNVDELEKNLTEELAVYKDYIVPDSYQLRIIEIKKDAVRMKFRFLLNRVTRPLEKEIRENSIRKVLDYLKSVSLKPLLVNT